MAAADKNALAVRRFVRFLGRALVQSGGPRERHDDWTFATLGHLAQDVRLEEFLILEHRTLEEGESMTTNADQRGGLDQFDGLEHGTTGVFDIVRVGQFVEFQIVFGFRPLASHQTFSIDEKYVFSPFYNSQNLFLINLNQI